MMGLPVLVECPTFNRSYKKSYKKHKGCFADDFEALIKTVKSNLENTRFTKKIKYLGEKYSKYPVHKSRLMIKELRGYDARLVWHHCKEKNEILLIEVYLKSQQKNHDKKTVIDAVLWYYC